MTSMPPTYQMPGSARQQIPGATPALVLGILSIVFSGPIIGIVLAAIGLVNARKGRAAVAANPAYYGDTGTLTAGYVCSIIGIVLGCLTTIGCCAYVSIIGFVLGAAGAASGAGGGGTGVGP